MGEDRGDATYNRLICILGVQNRRVRETKQVPDTSFYRSPGTSPEAEVC